MQRPTENLSFKKIRVKTQLGTFVLMFNEKGLSAVRFPRRCNRRTPARCDVAHLVGVKWLRVNDRLDLSHCTLFERKVYAALMKVPAGKTVTYGELAKRAGFPGAARAVGSALKKNRLPLIIPCHRVVPASVPIPINFYEAEIGAVQTTILGKNGKVWTGGLGQYSAGVLWKRALLEYERHRGA